MKVHLDDCPEDNGALMVVPGSHRFRMSARELSALDRAAFTPCPARAGDLLLMRPLLVHRSSPARRPRHRRVLHVLYAPARGGSDDPERG